MITSWNQHSHILNRIFNRVATNNSTPLLLALRAGVGAGVGIEIGIGSRIDPYCSLSSNSRQCFSSFSKKKQEKSKPKYKKKQGQKQGQVQPKPPRQPRMKKETKTKEAPPLFLYQTASPTVYISSIAIDNSYSSYNDEDEKKNDDDDDDTDDDDDNDIENNSSSQIHPKTLFTETKIPHSFSNSTFEYMSPKLFNHELPTNASIPEIAILGRSNVGKSSLLNSITRSKDLARISKTPGRTQQVNYFGQFVVNVNDGLNDNGGGGDKKDGRDIVCTPPIGYIIDLPGYGM